MTIEVDQTERDFVRATLLAARRTKTRRIWASVMFGVPIMLLGFMMPRRAGEFAWGYQIIGGYMLLNAVLTPLAFRRAYQKYWKATPVQQNRRTYVIDENGFLLDSYAEYSLMRWHAFSHWEETREFFLAYYGMQAAYYVPKRLLNEAQTTELREWFSKMIGRTKYEKPVPAFPVEEGA